MRGGAVFNDLEFQDNTQVQYSINSSFTVEGNLTIDLDSSVNSRIATGGSPVSITLLGNLTLSDGNFGNPFFNDPNLTLIMSGSGNQTISVAGIASANFRANLTINKSGGLASLASPFTMLSSRDLTITAGIFSLNGNDFSKVGGAFSNNGTFRLQGGESIAGLTQDTDSGIWEYKGDGDSLVDNIPIRDFGVKDYFNLVLNATDGLSDTFTTASDLSVNGSLTLSAGNYAPGANTTSVGNMQFD